MTSFFSVIPVVMRRVSANARLLAVIIGAILASALMSTTSIYTDAIRDLGLDHAIREQGPDKINLLIRSSSHPSAKETIDKDDLVQTTTQQNIGPLVNGEITQVARSETFYVAAPGQTIPANLPPAQTRSFFQHLSNLETHITVTDGKFPGDQAPGAGAPNLDVALGKATADRLGLKVGDRFDLFFYNALPKGAGARHDQRPRRAEGREGAVLAGPDGLLHVPEQRLGDARLLHQRGHVLQHDRPLSAEHDDGLRLPRLPEDGLAERAQRHPGARVAEPR